MFTLTRRAFDASRLASELDRTEARIKELERQLYLVPHGARFAEVARDFDVSQLHAEVCQQVIDDLSPILEKSALRMLKEGMRTLPRETRRPMSMQVAYEETSACYDFRFESPAMVTMVRSTL